MAGPDEKGLDERLREMARHRGLKLVKSRRRRPGGDYGKYGLKSAKDDAPCLGLGPDGLEASAEEVEAYLRGSAARSWKSSLGGEGRGKAAKTSKARAASSPQPAKAAATRPKRRRAEAPQPEAPPVEARAPLLVIRKAKAADAPALARLIGGEADEKDVARHLDRAAAQDEPILLAEEEEVLGMVAYHAFAVPHRREQIGRISFLLVAEPARRRGLGRALAQAALERLEKAGCDPIEMVSEVGYGENGRFARALGFDGRDYRFVRRPVG